MSVILSVPSILFDLRLNQYENYYEPYNDIGHDRLDYWRTYMCKPLGTQSFHKLLYVNPNNYILVMYDKLWIIIPSKLYHGPYISPMLDISFIRDR